MRNFDVVVVMLFIAIFGFEFAYHLRFVDHMRTREVVRVLEN